MKSRAKSNNLSAALLLAAALAAALIAPGADAQGTQRADAWKTTVEAARKEARVVVYSAVMPQIQERLKADFERANPGISVEATRYPSGVLLTKLEQERDAKLDGADVHVFAETGWTEARTLDGALIRPSGPASQGWPAAYTLKGGAPILGIEPAVIAWNTKLVKTPITGYRDLLAPEYRGRIGLLDMTATAMAAAYDWIDRNQGGNFLSQLSGQQVKIYGTVTAGMQSAVAGELAVAGYLNIGVVVPLIKQGAPIAIVVPNPAFGVQYTGAAHSWARRPNAAQVFVDYLMSPRGQAVWHGEGESASPLPNIAGSLNIKTINPYNAAPYTPEVVNAARTRWNGLFKK